jgi:hypothetical protein
VEDGKSIDKARESSEGMRFTCARGLERVKGEKGGWGVYGLSGEPKECRRKLDGATLIAGIVSSGSMESVEIGVEDEEGTEDEKIGWMWESEADLERGIIVAMKEVYRTHRKRSWSTSRSTSWILSYIGHNIILSGHGN